MKISVSLYLVFFALLGLLALTGCESLPEDLGVGREAVYKRQKQADTALEIPPDLTRSSIHDSLVVPDSRATGTATYSDYASERTGGRRIDASQEVLPRFEDITVKRDGDQRWLLIRATAEQVWPKLEDFWLDNGILLIEEDPTVGIMETGWIENRANIKSDFITDTLRGFVDGLYASGTRDQFRVRLEPGEEPDTTALFLTHRGMQEILASASSGGETDRPIWQSRPNDPGLEAEMLRRIMIYLGVSDVQARKALAVKEREPRSHLIKDRNGMTRLDIDETFARAWRLTGVALDRVGFLVEDRDRASGIYFVRYNDPTASQPEREQGFLSKLAFWRSDKEKTKDGSEYRISLREVGEKTVVEVLGEDSKPDTSSTARRILTLLHEQIR